MRGLITSAALAAIFLSSVTAMASPIAYTFSGNASGLVNDAIFSNAGYRITLVGDTTGVSVFLPGIYQNAVSATMEIDGFGVMPIVEALQVFSNTNNSAIGFSYPSLSDILDVGDPSVATYDLTTALGPFTSDPIFVNLFLQSSAGPISFNNAGPVAFRAKLLPTCALAPAAGCGASPGGSLVLKGNFDPAKQKLKWTWRKGPGQLSDFGLPVEVTNYLLCIYDDGSLAMTARIDEGGTCDGGNDCWTAGATSLEYKNRSTNTYGIAQVKIGAKFGTASVSVNGKGIGLELPFPIADTTAVTVQLFSNIDITTTNCWETVLPPPAKVNDATKLKFVDKIP